MSTTAQTTETESTEIEKIEEIGKIERIEKIEEVAAPTKTQATQAKPAPSKKPAPAKKPQQQRKPRPPVSQARVTIPGQLRSRQAQKLYRYNFETASYALYTMSVILPTMVDEKSVLDVSGVVDGEIDAVRNDLASEIERAKEMAETNGIDLDAVQYSKPQKITVEINSPKAGQFFGLIREMDRLIGMLDMLWLSGIYNDHQYNTGCYQWQRRISKLANRLRNIAQRTMAMARRRMDDKRNASLDGLFDPDGDFVFRESVGALAQQDDEANEDKDEEDEESEEDGEGVETSEVSESSEENDVADSDTTEK